MKNVIKRAPSKLACNWPSVSSLARLQRAKLRFYFKYWGNFYENLQKIPVILYIYQVTARRKC